MGGRPKHTSNRPPKNSSGLKLHISNKQRSLPLSKPPVKRAVEALCLFLKISCDELSIFFVSTKKICALHAQFFNDPSPTDCITFPIDSSYLGDLFICPDTAILYAEARNEDPYKETLLYIVHGLLHLIGYDDLDPKKRRTMRKMEKKCMDHLNGLGITLG